MALRMLGLLTPSWKQQVVHQLLCRTAGDIEVPLCYMLLYATASVISRQLKAQPALQLDKIPGTGPTSLNHALAGFPACQ